MQTNPVAKWKQFNLFVALGLLLASIPFYDVYVAAAGSAYSWVWFGTHYVVALVGLAFLVRVVPLLAESARVYLEHTHDAGASMEE